MPFGELAWLALMATRSGRPLVRRPPGRPRKAEIELTSIPLQAKLELEANGFKLVESPEFLPWQHILIFSKAADPAQPPAPAIP